MGWPSSRACCGKDAVTVLPAHATVLSLADMPTQKTSAKTSQRARKATTPPADRIAKAVECLKRAAGVGRRTF